jgi:hypothetical protein
MTMPKMTTIPDIYNNIRGGIVEFLKMARSAAAQCQFHHG